MFLGGAFEVLKFSNYTRNSTKIENTPNDFFHHNNPQKYTRFVELHQIWQHWNQRKRLWLVIALDQ